MTITITKDRAKELLEPYCTKTQEGDKITLAHASATALLWALFEDFYAAEAFCLGFIEIGNPLCNARVALQKAETDESMLLKCREWIEHGLQLKTIDGEFPQ
jgi:hypothetical protein